MFRVIGCFLIDILICAEPALAGDQVRLKLLTSIKPLAMLIIEVAGDDHEVEVLLPSRVSPHHYSLRPSDMQRVRGADLIIWVGPSLEHFLAKPLTSLPSERQLVFSKLAADGDSTRDPHFWLDPIMAISAAGLIVERLISLDPAGAENYRKRLAQFAQSMQDLHRQHQAKLKPVQQSGFLAGHDAYHFFVQRYQLRQVGSFIDSQNHHHGLKTIAAVKEQVRQSNVACLVADSKEQGSTLSRALGESVQKQSIKVVVVDPLAPNIDLTGGSYNAFQREITEQFLRCLK